MSELSEEEISKVVFHCRCSYFVSELPEKNVMSMTKRDESQFVSELKMMRDLIVIQPATPDALCFTV